MVVTPAKVESVDDVLRFIPDNDISYYSHLDEDEIRNGSVCTCDKGKYVEDGDQRLYEGDKQGIAVCSDCDGFYGILLPNWH